MDPVCQALKKITSVPTAMSLKHYADKMGREDATRRIAISSKML